MLYQKALESEKKKRFIHSAYENYVKKKNKAPPNPHPASPEERAERTGKETAV